MDLGIDLGTTHTVVASVDRGNYPVMSFQDEDGDSHDHIPSLTALVDGQMVHGFAAAAAMVAGRPGIRSVKRALANPAVTFATPVHIGDTAVPIGELLTSYLRHVIDQIHLNGADGELRVVVGVPAHAHTGQRFVTIEAFKAAGFTVLGMVNEPSAAGLEYSLRQSRTLNSRRTRVIIYDLGGGTFDASLVDMSGTSGEVIDSVGLNDLGGDDFDRVLADLVTPRITAEVPPRDSLLEACRLAKEGIRSQSRNALVDLPDETVRIPVAEFEQACHPLVDRSLSVMEPLSKLLQSDPAKSDVAGIDMVGGSTSLPLVPRLVRELFGRRVHRSPNPTASTAIGLAIAADPTSPHSIRDRLSRGFGVFRETNWGQELAFDVLADQNLRLDSPTTITRRYQSRHNIGVYRFVEFSRTDADGTPRGDLSPFAEIVVPLDEGLQRSGAPIDKAQVHPVDQGHWVEETYTIDSSGMVGAAITDLDTGWSVSTTMGRDRPVILPPSARRVPVPPAG
ncbi:Heat shock protein 70 [Acidipropionibacterium jensenii]|uniref:Heat shock protein 70 n=2 Tax=Acidipropionibacterium jensenii TaxID=1749 RepID=A0A3S4YMA4_9ACTN|nr:Hsp70 family protein [Acidipropionibacterium jensenii]MDN6425782.1 Hsp70 family protein [Acidipropionibacterium jensenii]MDN6440990.1 Hsp70 family protein [Acidipropionibacterium jensenii]MDN6479837.1 Hsp70 family protein [Acidipropionibacterium jensenii]MDN6511748.1 Hsp70 family protein [Acidipropionibacterium jensenii]MDN6591503.1 Hsp70 family protein [Acidipropionibacterium jensenii]